MKLLTIVGARPQFVKASVVSLALQKAGLEECILHTGQHFDDNMSDIFFRDLGIPAPQLRLDIHGGNHGEMTGRMLAEIESAILAQKPSAVLVYGDTNSTLAGALAAAKLNVPVAHVEAGLRSLDRSMPEEINRVLTDQISDYLFTTEREAGDNLAREGISNEKRHFVGNVMVDSVMDGLKRAIPAEQTFASSGCSFDPANYALLTLHRPSNVDDKDVFTRLAKALSSIGKKTPVFFPVHPRTKKAIESFGLEALFDGSSIFLAPPQPYLSMLGLMKDAKIVLTDSGGLQEETTALGVPCLTLRDNTERWITVREGTNIIVGTEPDRILAAHQAILEGETKKGSRPELWDGKAAERIVSVNRNGA